MGIFDGNGRANFIWGSGEDDIIRARGGNDTVHGNGGHDWIGGGRGDDELHGGTGNDTLLGKDGDDELFGDTGNDIIDGGEGADILTGGAGVDVFYFAEGDANDDRDVITDFEIGVDTIVISGGYGWVLIDGTDTGDGVGIGSIAHPNASGDLIHLPNITDFEDFEANANILFV
ncbi:hypothetical protein HKCCE2091_01285 [Rhodobacterales bacterium HKCCE2091]|nr:hypothetical protein [Rhodobacterales bacterium HKCCE2091]